MNNTQTLKYMYKIQEINKNSEIDDILNTIIGDLKNDIAKEKCSKPTEKKALSLLRKLQKKSDKTRPALQYVFVDGEKMFFTDAYFLVALNKKESWIDGLNIFDKEKHGTYPDVKLLLNRTKKAVESGENVSLVIEKKTVDYWKKTVKKEDGKQIVKLHACDSEENVYNCSFDVQRLDYVLTLLQAEELTITAHLNSKEATDIFQPFLAENENGIALVMPVRSYH